jgi:hypothetical protein
VSSRQVVSSGEQLEHVPAMQFAPASPVPQLCPQVPQLFESVSRLTQVGPHATWPCGHVGAVDEQLVRHLWLFAPAQFAVHCGLSFPEQKDWHWALLLPTQVFWQWGLLLPKQLYWQWGLLSPVQSCTHCGRLEPVQKAVQVAGSPAARARKGGRRAAASSVAARPPPRRPSASRRESGWAMRLLRLSNQCSMVSPRRGDEEQALAFLLAIPYSRRCRHVQGRSSAASQPLLTLDNRNVTIIQTG